MIYIHPTAATNPAALAKLEQATGLQAQLHQHRAVLVPKTLLSFAITKPPAHPSQDWTRTGGAA